MTVSGATAAAFAATGFTATVNNIISTGFQSFFCLPSNASIAISQSSRQSSNNIFVAAARILAELIAKLIGGFFTNAFIGVVQGINHGSQNFRIALAIVLVTKFVDRSSSLACIAGCLRLVD